MNNQQHIEQHCAVYQIRNTIDGKRYIGSTANPTKRKSRHYSDLNANTHTNPPLQQSYNDHGPENFVFEILENVEDLGNLRDVENKHLSAADNLYNISKFATGDAYTLNSHPLGDQIRHKISGENNHKFIGYCVTPWGTFGSAHAAAKAGDGLMSHNSIQTHCKKPDTIITADSYAMSPYLNHNCYKKVIGMTWGDIGFSFIPKP